MMKTMYLVCCANGIITKDYSEILKEQYCFFKKLYTKDPNVNFNVQNVSGKKLDALQKMHMEEEITKPELFDAMMTLKSGKCPGRDGIPIEFYCKFWNKLVDPLFEVFQHALLEKGRLNHTARCGIINLISKKDKDELLIKNWRPIMLLNCDYKIFTKLLANHLSLVVDDLIGPQQTGFIKGRSIHCNILKTREVISYLNKNKLPGVIAMIDFEKCFDHIDF